MRSSLSYGILNFAEISKRCWQSAVLAYFPVQTSQQGFIQSIWFQGHFGGKVIPNTFWLKCKNLPKCTKFCLIRKLEVAAKSFGLLTKNCFMHWKIRGLKGSISGNFCVVCLNLWTQTLLVAIAIGAHMSYCYQLVLNNPMLMIIKRIWDLNLFLPPKVSMSNFRIYFAGSLAFNLKFKNIHTQRFFLIR